VHLKLKQQHQPAKTAQCRHHHPSLKSPRCECEIKLAQEQAGRQELAGRSTVNSWSLIATLSSTHTLCPCQFCLLELAADSTAVEQSRTNLSCTSCHTNLPRNSNNSSSDEINSSSQVPPSIRPRRGYNFSMLVPF
jgi:hypothetical protein